MNILIVEDNPIDVMVTREALSNAGGSHDIHVAQDGVEAMDFLKRVGMYTQAPRPDIILLDLNLPKKDGREVLSEIKGHSELKRIPVVVLSTSKASEDILKSYELHANCFVTKPVDLDHFVLVIKSVQEFWFSIAKLPFR